MSVREGKYASGVLTNFLARDDTVLDGARETLASLLLVSVVTSTVEEAVASLEGVVDGLRGRRQGFDRRNLQCKVLRPRTEGGGPERGVSKCPRR